MLNTDTPTKGPNTYTQTIRKQSGLKFTQETEVAFKEPKIPTYPHTASTTLTNIIPQKDKHHLPKVKMNDEA